MKRIALFMLASNLWFVTCGCVKSKKLQMPSCF
ncbi:MAG: hypothetical protein JWR72_2242 [Flavisolibacter sp.]|jgi:hypothetical protein|nr:hypothetical protein [Flavisolibacter sp.]